ncbi:MAG: tyrosine-type recombinase/integrase [Planctomycetes bacterium]|nr:tyrosine-type recombinase/integrase [Planctomycetota bacterium]
MVCTIDLRRETSTYRILDDQGHKVRPVNRFLASVAIRGLSETTARTYAYDLLHFWRWFTRTGMALRNLTEGKLLEYIAFHQESGEHPAPASINQRLAVVRMFYRYATGKSLDSSRVVNGRPPYERGPCASTGYLGRTRQRPPGLHVKMERRVVIPLAPEEVADFLESLRTWRDLGIVGLMLSSGLRTREILHLGLDDVSFAQGQVLVHGKGRKQRIVPLSPEVTPVLLSYLEIERPAHVCDRFFVCLKGPARGHPMTPAGIRSIFRHHRATSGIPKANPHRFRHTFGSDMARAGVTLPALMHLMGHANIHTTMLYVALAPQDVWEQFQSAVAKIRDLRRNGSRRG